MEALAAPLGDAVFFAGDATHADALGTLRGKFHDFYGIPLMVTYHPAALLRNSQWKRPTWEDVKLLRTRYDQLTGDES